MDQNNIIELHSVAIYHRRESLSPFVLGRSYKKGDLVLSDVNLSLGIGEMLYLIGRVGSGKSTLLKTLYAELPLIEGDGKIVGYDLRKLRRSQIPYLRRRIGVVFQDYQLLTDRNVFNNLHYVMRATGWRNETEMCSKIEEVLHLVGLHNKEYKMPFQLSGGEQQRLSIARALINDPKVILADEPTGNLDPSATDEIMCLFKTIVDRGCSILMSTHNIGNIQQFPARTVRCNQGRIEDVDIHTILGI